MIIIILPGCKSLLEVLVILIWVHTMNHIILYSVWDSAKTYGTTLLILHSIITKLLMEEHSWILSFLFSIMTSLVVSPMGLTNYMYLLYQAEEINFCILLKRIKIWMELDTEVYGLMINLSMRDLEQLSEIHFQIISITKCSIDIWQFLYLQVRYNHLINLFD